MIPPLDVQLDELALAELRAWDESRMKERAEVMRRLERATAKRREVLDRLHNPTHWRAADGRSMRIDVDMTPNHAANAAAMLLKDRQRHYLDSGLWGDQGLEGWMEAMPVYQALVRRSKDRATFAERRRDKRARKKFQKEEAELAAKRRQRRPPFDPLDF